MLGGILPQLQRRPTFTRLFFQVSVSMLEIYNETVKDLLNLASFKKGGLRVREQPQKGFFGEMFAFKAVLMIPMVVLMSADDTDGCVFD